MDDEQQIMRRAAHNPHAFAPLYEAYAVRVYNFCWRRLGNEQEAEDCASDVFVRALHSLNTYKGGMFAAWLFGIAHFTLIDHLRRRRPSISMDDELTVVDERARTDYEAAETRLHLAQLLRGITDEEAEMLALYIDAELTSAEIGIVLGKSAGTVRVALHRLFKRLREQIIEELKG